MKQLSKRYYSKVSDWIKEYKNREFKIDGLYDKSWEEIMEKLMKDNRYKKIEERLKDEIDKNKKIYPKPSYIFRSLLLTPMNEVSVVILGQDPYHGFEQYKKREAPLATGLSFSVMDGMKIPSSLSNIFNNMKKYGHLKTIPTNGCLEGWAMQGCLMLNTSLTVCDAEPNCHSEIWKWFTDSLIKYISDKLNNVIFVLWGAYAYKKSILIDQDKHEIIVSSHPSGLSANNIMGSYPAFNNYDHFGNINNLLKSKGKKQIIWDIFT